MSGECRGRVRKAEEAENTDTFVPICASRRYLGAAGELVERSAEVPVSIYTHCHIGYESQLVPQTLLTGEACVAPSYPDLSHL